MAHPASGSASCVVFLDSLMALCQWHSICLGIEYNVIELIFVSRLLRLIDSMLSVMALQEDSIDERLHARLL